MEPERPVPPADPALPRPGPAPTSASPARPDTTKRLLAKFIDFVVAAVLSWIVALIVPGWLTGALLGAVAAGAYLLVCDGLDVEFMRRRSLGKKVMGLNVVRVDGGAMDPATSARRNWMFTLGYFGQALTGGVWGVAALLSLVGFGLLVYETYRVVTDPAGRRWGDELGATRVVEA